MDVRRESKLKYWTQEDVVQALHLKTVDDDDVSSRSGCQNLDRAQYLCQQD